MSLFRTILDIINPPPPTLADLSKGLCALPQPKARAAAPKQEPAADLYVIYEEKRAFGFNFATAQKQSNGGVPELTAYDVELLKERDYWGGAKNKAMHSKNAACKRLWHIGDTESEAATKLGKSESWIEKRYGTFATALLIESAETGNV